ncbi:MAG: hypothetical protein ACI9DC_000136 [Gammaproteobacteria bacterium]|jgi:hypothetical protein
MHARAKQSKRLIQTVLFAPVFCGVSNTALASDLVIASSDDPLHVVGTIIDADEPFRVDAGRSVTLIAQDARKLRIRGPSHAAPDIGSDSDDGSILAALSRLLSRSADRSTMAVFRGSPRDRVHYVIALHHGEEPRCLSGTPQIRFAKPAGSNDDTLSISRTSGPSLSVAWPAAQSELDWPLAMAFVENAQYTVSLASQPKRSALQLFTHPQGLSSEAHAVAWMADKGCERDAQRGLQKLVR